MHIRGNTTLYFIRHGETPSNADGILQGNRLDPYLDSNGILQIEKLKPIVSHLDLDVLYTSYLHRAEETAILIEKGLEQKIPFLHDFRLRERDFGQLSGKTEAEAETLLPGWKEKDAMQMYDYRPFGGESIEQVRQRVLGAVLDMTQNHGRENIGVITHAGVIRLLLFHFHEIIRIYLGSENQELNISNTDIYEWEISDDHLARVRSLLKQTPLT